VNRDRVSPLLIICAPNDMKGLDVLQVFDSIFILRTKLSQYISSTPKTTLVATLEKKSSEKWVGD
jgi:hypothetical protein